MKKFSIAVYAAITLGLMVWGFYQAIYVAPNDAMQGEVFRIIYYHVPSASVAFLFFAISLCGSIGFLAFRRSNALRAQAADAWALAGAEVGVVFCTVVLTTGPDLGSPRLGHLVDLGRTADDDAGAVADLCELPAAAAVCGRAADADAGGGAGYFWRPGRADCLHVEPLVAHAASGSGVRWRLQRRDGPIDGGCIDVEYGGLAGVGSSDSCPALPS